MSNTEVKINRCVKCNYFDAAKDCKHCQKCLQYEVVGMIADSNTEIFKSNVLEKKLLKDVN